MYEHSFWLVYKWVYLILLLLEKTKVKSISLRYVNTYSFMFFTQKILYFTYFFITFFVFNPMEWQHTTHEYNTFQQIQIHVWWYISILVLFNFKMLLIIFSFHFDRPWWPKKAIKVHWRGGKLLHAKDDKILACGNLQHRRT